MSKDVSLISYDKEIEIISKCEHYSTDFHNMFGDIRSLHVRLTPLLKTTFRCRTVRIENRVFYGTEIEQPFPVNRKILAGADNLFPAFYQICPQHCFLRLDSEHIEDAAGDVFTDAAVCVEKTSWFILPGGRKFQHIDLTVIFHSDLASICSIICPARHDPAICEINHTFAP